MNIYVVGPNKVSTITLLGMNIRFHYIYTYTYIYIHILTIYIYTYIYINNIDRICGIPIIQFHHHNHNFAGQIFSQERTRLDARRSFKVLDQPLRLQMQVGSVGRGKPSRIWRLSRSSSNNSNLGHRELYRTMCHIQNKLGWGGLGLKAMERERGIELYIYII